MGLALPPYTGTRHVYSRVLYCPECSALETHFVELGLGSIEADGGLVVCPGRLLRRPKGPKPHSGLLHWVPYLGHPAAPGALPHAAERVLVVLRPALGDALHHHRAIQGGRRV